MAHDKITGNDGTPWRGVDFISRISPRIRICIRKRIVAHESGDPVVLFDEKTRGQKSQETVPLMLLAVRRK
jgi:hypothetical protein